MIYYPPPAFSFQVAIGSSRADAAFQEISGLDPKVELEDLVEGGLNAYVHKLPGATKHSNLVMKRGYFIGSSPLAKWAAQTVGSSWADPIQKQSLTVSLIGPPQTSAANPEDAASAAASRSTFATWDVQDAWPIKWEVGPFDSSKNDVLTESIEVAYATVTRRG
jgi:phage tail-like protein